MNIHQVSVSYVQEQDRLLLRINGREGGGELRAWLTRRMALALLPVLNKTAGEQMKKIAGPSEPAASLDEQRGQLLAAFQKEASLHGGDFETPYQLPRHPLDLPGGLPPSEPLLLTEVNVTLMDNAQLRVRMFERLPGQEAVRNFEVMMDAQLSNGLLHLLHQSLQLSQWRQAPALPAAPELPAGPEVSELPLDLAKPKYLN
jgi:hypothetical protein